MCKTIMLLVLPWVFIERKFQNASKFLTFNQKLDIGQITKHQK